ncbi:HD family phosphohydrolase [Vibrio alfacsensis]|uniref:HD-GYP domain-containing protein n=1 Tax=Vibrio alfacsensis TaxID=1074311 RepID=UPI001BEF4E47|nr:HD domain-containing phosphohydrolase [Vibrio alfacsensis]BBM63948.1 HD family phosphohydrolase [Vibrio alfacsensis]
MKVRLEIEQLRIGHYIYLPLKWGQHPFLLNSFKIKSDEQLRIIKRLGLKSLTINALKSDVFEELTTKPQSAEQGAKLSRNENEPPLQPLSEDLLEELWSKKKESRDQLAAIEDRICRSKQAFANTLNDVQKVFDQEELANNPSISQSLSIVNTIYKSINKEGNSTIHLMNEASGHNRLHCHSLNVSLLSVLIGQAKGFSAKQCQLVAFAALYHDIGKLKLPSSLLAKSQPLDDDDQQRLRSHLDKSLKMGERIPNFPEAALKVIGQHHELNDGSGYPKGLKREAINPLSRVLILANTYDNLCNGINHQYSPHKALTYLYNERREQYDVNDVMALIKVVGVYPPGTIVQLSDHQIGVVISTNESARLSPYVLVYDQQVPRDEAAIINIAEYDLSINKILDASELTLDQYHYLNPSSQTTYFIDVE